MPPILCTATYMTSLYVKYLRSIFRRMNGNELFYTFLYARLGLVAMDHTWTAERLISVTVNFYKSAETNSENDC